nr:hypothetical protein [Candidatus Njordarchaeota archaeon]
MEALWKIVAELISTSISGKRKAYLDMGEWMFVSLRTTELSDIPILIKAQNNEDILSIGVSIETILHHAS